MSVKPPTLGGLQLFAALHRFRTNPLEYMLRLQREYGDAICLETGFSRRFLFFDPVSLRELFVSKAKYFHKDRNSKLVLRYVFGDALVISEGELWQKQRRLMQPLFHGNALRDYVPTVAQYAAAMVEGWHESEPVDLTAEVSSLLLRITGKLLCNEEVPTSFAGEISALLIFLKRDLQQFWKIPPRLLPLGWRRHYIQSRAAVRQRIAAIVERRLNMGNGAQDLLGRLLAASSAEGGNDEMTYEQAKDEVLGLLVAGQESTTAALEWIVYLLARHPHEQERAAQEADSVLSSSVPAWEDIERLSYITNIVRESMRLYPPTWLLSRQCIEKTTIGGYEINKDDHVYTSPYVVHRNGAFFDDPDQFKPERFSDDAANINESIYMPFGLGPRFCPGRSLALTEMIMIVATVLRSFK
ncbi:MAG: cytochrome P450, partial [Terriglobales bacterium]